LARPGASHTPSGAPPKHERKSSAAASAGGLTGRYVNG
jgi:hypothetical protein